MTPAIPDEAVQATLDVPVVGGRENYIRSILTAAAPHLAAVRVNSDQIEAARKAVEELAHVQMNLPLEDWSRISSTILSALEPSNNPGTFDLDQMSPDQRVNISRPESQRALEPSAARELALEEAANEWPPLKQAIWRVLMDENLNDGHYISAFPFVEKLYDAALRALSSPDHADAGKVEGDGIERTEFNRGYILACANIVNLHGADVAVMEGFAQLGISKAELKALDLCEYDQRAIDALEDYFGTDKLYRTPAPASEGAE